MKKESLEKFVALFLMKGGDQSKYFTLYKGFISQFYLEDCQYPRTIKTSTYVLYDHNLDLKLYDNKKCSHYKARNVTGD